MSDNAKIALCAILITILSVVIAYTIPKDSDGAQQEAERYCQMVYRGLWPDFHHNYKTYCTSEGHWNGR